MKRAPHPNCGREDSVLRPPLLASPHECLGADGDNVDRQLLVPRPGFVLVLERVGVGALSR